MSVLFMTITFRLNQYAAPSKHAVNAELSNVVLIFKLTCLCLGVTSQRVAYVK